MYRSIKDNLFIIKNRFEYVQIFSCYAFFVFQFVRFFNTWISEKCRIFDHDTKYTVYQIPLLLAFANLWVVWAPTKLGLPIGWNLLNTFVIELIQCRGTSILGEVCNVEISRATQQLICSKSHDFLAVFTLAHSKINEIAYFFDEIIKEVSD